MIKKSFPKADWLKEESVDWSKHDKHTKLSKYLPPIGDGDTQATQIATAVSRLVYKWYNDGDVYDNTYIMEGWANDISGCANWLHAHLAGAAEILAQIEYCDMDSKYEQILWHLSELAESVIDNYASVPRIGDAYDEDGPYKFSDRWSGSDEDDEITVW